MKCKFLTLILLLFSYSNISLTEIYDYKDTNELIDQQQDISEIDNVGEWDSNNIVLNLRKDLLDNSYDRIYFKGEINNTITQLKYIDNDNLALFTQYKTNDFIIGFGRYRPKFGLGNIYSSYSENNFQSRVASNSLLDLNGIFISYNTGTTNYDFFYSDTNLKTQSDSLLIHSLVYSNDNTTKFKHYGIIFARNYDFINIGFLVTRYNSENILKQLDMKKNVNLISSSITYNKDNLIIASEINKLSSDLDYSMLLDYSNNGIKTKWNYSHYSAKSLNWMSSGVSNKYNNNSDIYSAKCKIPLSAWSLDFMYEYKKNSYIPQWRSKSQIKVISPLPISYQLTKDIFRDLKSQKHTKYTHRIIANLFEFEQWDVNFNYYLNNKKESGFAKKYQLIFSHKSQWGTLKLDMKVLDNYKNEEVIQDINKNIIATFYEYSEDMLISINFRSRKTKKISLSINVRQSLYNEKLDTAKIELNYHLN